MQRYHLIATGRNSHRELRRVVVAMDPADAAEFADILSMTGASGVSVNLVDEPDAEPQPDHLVGG